MSDGCVICGQPRWKGPKGDNHKLTRCEQHQREYWNAAKERKRREAGKRIGKGRPVKSAAPLTVVSPQPVALVEAEPRSIVKRMVIDYTTNTLIFTDVMRLSDAKTLKRDFAAWVGLMRHLGYEVEIREAALEAVG